MSEIREQNRKKLEPLCEAISLALSTVVDVDAISRQEIDSILIDAEKETHDCHRAVECMREMSHCMQTEILPVMGRNEREIEKLYNIIDKV